MDGVVRGGGFSSNTDATRSSRKWIGTLPPSNSAVNIGFPVNGVFRSGQYVGGDCRVGYYRCAWRGLRSDYYVPSRPIAYVGFRI